MWVEEDEESGVDFGDRVFCVFCVFSVFCVFCVFCVLVARFFLLICMFLIRNCFVSSLRRHVIDGHF